MQELFVHGQVAALDLARRLRRRLADERGQGTVEYVGLIRVSMLMVGMVVAMRGFHELRA